jgi:acyl phosphate:glycerol-3-phosphate acyltransferase
MTSALYLLAASVGYLLGSMPVGYLVARSRGVDIFRTGSCNPGATNVKRVLGKGPGNFVFAMDFLKGVAATGWPHLIDLSSDDRIIISLVGMVFAILGHSFSMFTGFRGGKGVATTLGAMLALFPTAAIAGTVVWLIFFYSTRYVSFASICLALTLPLENLAYSLFTGQPLGLRLWVSAAVAIFIILRHQANIRRLLQGKENRFEFGKKSKEPSERSDSPTPKP